MSIYIAKDGKNWGPYDPKQVSVLVEHGSFEKNDWAWVEGDPDWTPVSEVLAEWEAAEAAGRELEVQKELAKLTAEIQQPTESTKPAEPLDETPRKKSALVPEKQSRWKAWWNRHCFIFVFGLGAAGLIALLVLRPPSIADYHSLETRDGLAYAPEASEPFEGEAVSHYPNGQLMFRAEYRAGKQHGEMISYFADGQIQSEGTLSDGRFHGKVVYYHPNGEVQSHYVYRNGEATSRKNWDAAGNMVDRGQ